MFLAGGLGLLIGVVIGAFGGGGGVLTVPALVYLLGLTAQAATTSSLVVVGVTAVVGTLARGLSGLVAWRTGLAFAVVGVPAAWLGSLLNGRVAEPVLLLSFAALALLAAAALLLGANGVDAAEPETREAAGRAAGSALGIAARTRPLLGTASKILGCGSAIGFLTGFLGVGGGFLVVPALVLVLRMPMARAIGTSLLIIAGNAAVALGSRVATMDVDLAVVAPFAAAAVVGTLAGKSVSDRLAGPTVARAFAGVLFLVGALVAVQSTVALTAG